MKLNEVNKYSYAVLGLARSGISAARLLKRKGAKVFISESSNENELKYFDSQILKKENIEYEAGGHTDKIFEYDVIIKSPGIPMNSDIILKAKKLNKKIFSEIELAFWFCPCPVVAITGTNGKSSTTVLTGEIFSNAGFDVRVCGNIGLPFADVIDDLQSSSVAVLEVSSFQLENIKDFKPRISVITNITEDHIDRHGNFENYVDSKMKINSNQNGNDLLVYNYDDPVLKSHIKKVKSRVSAFTTNGKIIKNNIFNSCYLQGNEIFYFECKTGKDEFIINKDDIYIKGLHNVYNSMASIISAKEFGIDNSIICKTLKKFKGVEHRIEFVKEIEGVSFYNDSKATNFDSLKVALNTFEKNIILIMGGRGVDHKYDDVKELINMRVKCIICLGETKDQIYDYFSGFKRTIKVNTLQEAVSLAHAYCQKGDIVLFSPAYKSFDMFDNYEHRGKEFKKYVNELK